MNITGKHRIFPAPVAFLGKGVPEPRTVEAGETARVERGEGVIFVPTPRVSHSAVVGGPQVVYAYLVDAKEPVSISGPGLLYGPIAAETRLDGRLDDLNGMVTYGYLAVLVLSLLNICLVYRVVDLTLAGPALYAVFGVFGLLAVISLGLLLVRPKLFRADAVSRSTFSAETGLLVRGAK